VNLLLDTHAFLWFIGGDAKLSSVARNVIEDATNQPLLSVASLWEMAIKASLGKLSMGQPFDTLIPQQLEINGIELLGIEIQHTAVVSSLPFHHRDPFDRVLVAQAMVEQIPVVSADAVFDAYGVTRMW
jgi:PIN domain nuclease of toxin-antitoxin system